MSSRRNRSAAGRSLTQNSVPISRMLLLPTFTSKALLMRPAVSVECRWSDATPAPSIIVEHPLVYAELQPGHFEAGMMSKVTIKHGPMPKLDMPAMTMTYRVKDKAMLDKLKPGDKIRFEAEGVGGTFTVTRLEKAK